MSLKLHEPANIAKANVGTSAVVLTSTDFRPECANFSAPFSNVGKIYIGGSDVSATNFFFALEPGESLEVVAEKDRKLKLSSFYGIAENTTDDACVGFLR